MAPGWNYQPIEAQELLLRAALSAGQDALAAWRTWSALSDQEQIPSDAFPILPALYRNLERLGVEDPFMKKLGGVYRSVWYRNSLLLRSATDVLKALGDAGIQALVVNGAAVLLTTHEDYGLRTLPTLDVMIRPVEVEVAADILMRGGWRDLSQNVSLATRTAFYDSMCLERDEGQRLCLHWRMPLRACGIADPDLRERVVQVKVGQTAAHASGWAESLVWVCSQAGAFTDDPPVWWIPDALAILPACGSMDWNLVTLLAERCAVTTTVGRALVYLRRTFATPVPDAVVELLLTAPVTRLERAELWLRGSALAGRLGQLPNLWFGYVREFKAQGVLRRAYGFVRYLQCAWNLRSAWLVPVWAVRKAARRVFRLIEQSVSGSSKIDINRKMDTIA